MMTGRDDYADELLSATWTAKSRPRNASRSRSGWRGAPSYASRLEALRALQEALRALPRYRLAPEVEERILREIERLAAESARPAAAEDIEAELLSAYVDGEVSPAERELIAQRLAGNAAYASRLQALRALQEALRDLPRYRLSPAVQERILGEIERLAAEVGAPRRLRKSSRSC